MSFYPADRLVQPKTW